MKALITISVNAWYGEYRHTLGVFGMFTPPFTEGCLGIQTLPFLPKGCLEVFKHPLLLLCDKRNAKQYNVEFCSAGMWNHLKAFFILLVTCLLKHPPPLNNPGYAYVYEWGFEGLAG